MPLFRDIPQFTRTASYAVDVPWSHLARYVVRSVEDTNLNVNPPFQRAHVWNETQKKRYVEYILRGGVSGKDIYCNNPGWNRLAMNSDYVLVDGKQRLDAVFGFLNDEFTVFDENGYGSGALFSEFTDSLRITQATFKWHVNDLSTYEEVLQWYIDLNSGGVVHTKDEIEKVEALLKAKATYESPEKEQLQADAGFNRGILKKALAEIRAEEAKTANARDAAREAIAKSRKGKRK